MPSRPAHAPKHNDGRLLRGERARAAVADALLALLREGDIQPTAPRIAERAGVSLRTIFHHFADLETLFRDVMERQRERIAELVVPIAADGPLEERLQALARQRALLYEAIAPVRRAALLHEPFSPAISTGLAAFRALKRGQIEHLFRGELSALPEPERRKVACALSAAASFSAWDVLRRQQGLPAEQAERVLLRTLRALLAAAGPSSPSRGLP